MIRGGEGKIVLAESDFDLCENEPVVETQYNWFHKLVLMKREKIIKKWTAGLIFQKHLKQNLIRSQAI